jgi:hypothetical protein
VEWLKLQALSSNHSTAKKTQKDLRVLLIVKRPTPSLNHDHESSEHSRQMKNEIQRDKTGHKTRNQSGNKYFNITRN